MDYTIEQIFNSTTPSQRFKIAQTYNNDQKYSQNELLAIISAYAQKHDYTLSHHELIHTAQDINHFFLNKLCPPRFGIFTDERYERIENVTQKIKLPNKNLPVLDHFINQHFHN